VSQSQLDNLVSSWLFDDGTEFSLDCNWVFIINNVIK
jgi:hypothetical protein